MLIVNGMEKLDPKVVKAMDIDGLQKILDFCKDLDEIKELGSTVNISDIITDGVDGFLIKDWNEKAFADKVCLLIEDADLRQKMGQAAIGSSRRYQQDRIMSEWKKLFESLCSKQVLG